MHIQVLCSSILCWYVNKCVKIVYAVAPSIFKNVFVVVQSDTKKPIITQNRITARILFQSTQNSSYTLGQIYVEHISKVLSLYYIYLLFHWSPNKYAPNEILGSAGTFGCTFGYDGEKIAMTSSLEIALICAMIAAFRSGIV